MAGSKQILLLLVAVMSAGCERSPEPTVDPAPAAAPETTEAPGSGPVSTDTPAPEASEAQVDQSIDALLGDHTRYRAVIDDLQKAVRADDAAAVAKLIDYPISVKIDGKDVTIDGETRFVAEYEKFMTPAIKQAILGTAYPDVMVNYQGVMLGSGEVWINGICKDGGQGCQQFDVKVVTIQPALQ